MTPFARRVLTVVRSIPPGRVATYGDVAAMAGRPRAARAVGTVMRDCSDPGVPCHRVIAAGGALGGFGSSPHLKRQLLAAEGIALSGRRVRQFAALRWTGRPGGMGSARRTLRPVIERHRTCAGTRAYPSGYPVWSRATNSEPFHV